MNCVAVTGATSMLGVALINQCIQNGVEVLAFLRSGTIRIDRLPKSDLIRIIYCDLDQLENAQIDNYNPDTFYHIGWSNTEQSNRNNSVLQERNIFFTLNAVRLAQRLGCKRFIGTGSQAEYGRANSIIGPETQTNPETAYGVAKYAAGKLSSLECDRLGIDHVWVRVFSVYGKYDNDGTLLNTFISRVQANESMSLTKCEQIWDYLHEDDAGRALYLLGEKATPAKVYCLGSGEGRPLINFLEDVKNVINRGYKINVGEIPYGERQIMYLCADVSALKRDLNWYPQVDFISGISRIYRAKGN